MYLIHDAKQHIKNVERYMDRWRKQREDEKRRNKWVEPYDSYRKGDGDWYEENDIADEQPCLIDGMRRDMEERTGKPYHGPFHISCRCRRCVPYSL